MKTIHSKIITQDVLDLWENHFNGTSRKRAYLLSFVAICLAPTALIDYPSIASEDQTLFLIARTLPSILIGLHLIAYYLLKYRNEVAYYVMFVLLMTASTIRTSNTDTINYLTGSGIVFIFAAATFYIKPTHAILMSVYALFIHMLVYFLLYAKYLLFNDSGILTVLALSVMNAIVSNSRYNINKRNFITSYKLKEQNEKITKQTKDLHDLVEEVNQQKEAISTQRNAIEEKNKTLQTTLDDLAKKNKNIMSSIVYAKRIQDAIFPKVADIKNTFLDAFVLFIPRDIVSGDFYFFIKKQNYTFLAVADCTGHGVPGSLMSMIGINFLRQIIIEKNKTMPADILLNLHQSIVVLLKQDQSNNRDGMDIALIMIDNENQTLSFSGAKNPLIVIRDHELIEYKASNHSIGGKLDQINFENHHIALDVSMSFYMYSDGYQDQFGGRNKVKFLSKRFKKLLFKNHMLPFKEQQEKLNRVFFDWRTKSNVPQIDDVLVVGFKI